VSSASIFTGTYNIISRLIPRKTESIPTNSNQLFSSFAQKSLVYVLYMTLYMNKMPAVKILLKVKNSYYLPSKCKSHA